MHAHCGVLRERVLRASAACFGHRLMMDAIAPGGVAADLAPQGAARIRDLVGVARRAFPPLVELYDNTASLQDRTVGAGVAQPVLVRQYGCGGYIGRASGRSFDASATSPIRLMMRFVSKSPRWRKATSTPRVWIRIREVEQSLSLVEQILDLMPMMALRARPSRQAGGARA